MTSRTERCEHCTGLHTGQSRKTKQIYDDGGSYCHRCGYVTKGTNIVELLKALQTDLNDEEEIVQPLYNWRTYRRYPLEHERTTILQSYKSIRDGYVAFRMTKSNGELIGFHNRSTHSKDFFTEGDRGISFSGERLRGTPSSPLIVVEGPYDCRTEQHVCVYGKITKNNISKFFKLQNIWLHPDPDCVDTAEKRKKFEKMIKELIDDHLVFIQGYIVSDADPDECVVMDHIHTERFYRLTR